MNVQLSREEVDLILDLIELTDIRDDEDQDENDPDYWVNQVVVLRNKLSVL
jgi:ABC-type Zn uptake system ZnuABC Zn-binding protein ZnuA